MRHGVDCDCTPCTIAPEDGVEDKTSPAWCSDTCGKGLCGWVDEPLICHNPETCTKMHNETDHHYGCECEACMVEYWLLKH